MLHNDEGTEVISADVNRDYTAARGWTLPRDPLVLDLDGDGIETVGIDPLAPILFDHDADGVKTGTGWIQSDDGLLVIDINGNGVIDSGRELFGDNSLLYTALDGPVYAADGYAALRAQDSNHDGVVNSLDANFNQLRVWRDLNQDGISQAGELQTLSQAGIASIGVTGTATNTNLGNGNTQVASGSFTRSDGSTGQSGSAQLTGSYLLAGNNFYRAFTDDPVPTAAALALPQMQGSGVARNLREAMSLGTPQASLLQQQVAAYAAAPTRAGQRALLEGVIGTWAQTTGWVLPNPTQRSFSLWTIDILPAGMTTGSGLTEQVTQAGFEFLQRLNFLEAFNGDKFFQFTEPAGGGFGLSSGGGGGGGGGSKAGGHVPVRMSQAQVDLINKSWAELEDSIYGALVMQTRLRPYLDSIELVIDANGISFSTAGLTALLNTVKSGDEGKAVLDLVELYQYAGSTMDAVDFAGISMLGGWIAALPAGSLLRTLLPGMHVYDTSVTVGTDTNDIWFGDGTNNTFNGGAGNDRLMGYAGDDTLYGGAGNDTLDGGAGNDFLNGGLGNNVYLFGRGDGQDTIGFTTDTSAGKLSTLRIKAGVAPSELVLRQVADTQLGGVTLQVSIAGTSDSITLNGFFRDGSPVNPYNSVQQFEFADGTVWDLAAIQAQLYAGTAGADSLSGTTGNDTISGGAGADVLYGGDGNDVLSGGADNDVLYGDNGNDTYRFGLGDGQDTIVDTQGQNTLSFRAGVTATDLSYSLVNGNLIVKVGSGTDQITLVGWQTASERVNAISFADGSSMVLNESVLNHLPVAVVDSAGLSEDVAVVTGNVLANDSDLDAGTVLSVVAAGSFTGQYGTLVIAANGAYTYTQNGSTQTLRAGQTVTDVFSYSVSDNASFQAGIASSSLTITISGTNDAPTLLTAAVNQQAIETQVFTYVLPANMFADVDVGDTLTLRAILAGGAVLPTWLAFNASTRTFTGTPSNTASGVLSIQVSATDVAGAVVTTGFSLDITNFINGTTAADTLTGTAARDVIYGLAGNDTINGGAGADTMVGGLGNDAYTVDDVGDTVVELLGEGTDTVNASVSYTLADNVEILTLTGASSVNATGNALNNTLNGNAGNNVLNGGAGADTMVGGAGNDTYYVDNAGDITTEAANAGTDTVIASVNWTLGTNIENLTLAGLSNINATGNAVANVLTGNAGNNVLNGGAGADTMLGGAGDDTYVVDVVGDVVTENLNEGIDLVQAGIAYTLGANVENLTLTGGGAINGTGNGLANVLVGNTGTNILTGGAGNDTLDGKAGADSLVGGTGNDTYLLGRGYGIDTITENDATVGNTDIAKFDATVANNQLWFVKVGNNLEVSIIGTTDKFVMTNWYLGSQYHVEQFRSGDGKTLLDSQVQNLVSAMAAFTPPAAGVTTLPANYATTLQPVLAANWV